MLNCFDERCFSDDGDGRAGERLTLEALIEPGEHILIGNVSGRVRWRPCSCDDSTYKTARGAGNVYLSSVAASRRARALATSL